MGGKPIAGPGGDRAMVFQEFGLMPLAHRAGQCGAGLELKGMAGSRRGARSRSR